MRTTAPAVDGAGRSAALIDRPLRLAAGTLATNRLQLAPMTNRLSAVGGEITHADIDWYRGRGEAGFSTIVTGGLSVSPAGQLHIDQPRADDDRFMPGFARLSTARHPGTVMLAQLLHGGLRVNAWEERRAEPVGPSDGVGVRGLASGEVEATLDDFVAAGTRAVSAGFDGVEIHAAHGYLPAQFLSREENQRTDRWGGDFTGRARFTLELVARLRAALPADTVVQLRISAEDMRQSRGIDLDESAALARLGAEAGADVISLSVWDIHQAAQKHPHTTPTEHVKAHLGDVAPLVVAGKIWTAEDAVLAFAQGADALAVGRAAIFNRAAPTILRTQGLAAVRPPVLPSSLVHEGIAPPFLAHLLRRWGGLFLPEDAAASA